MVKSVEQIKVRIALIQEQLPILEKQWRKSTDAIGSFVTGSDNRSKTLDCRLDAENTRMSAAFARWNKLRDELSFWQRRMVAIEAGEVHLNGQPRADSPSRQARARLDEALTDYCRDTLKPGSIVYVAANPVNTLTVKRASKKSITCTDNVRWSYGEILTPVHKELGDREFVKLLVSEGYLKLR